MPTTSTYIVKVRTKKNFGRVHAIRATSPQEAKVKLLSRHSWQWVQSVKSISASKLKPTTRRRKSRRSKT